MDSEQQEEQPGNFDYTEAAATAEGLGESNPNENKWNKNGFGQGKDEYQRSYLLVLWLSGETKEMHFLIEILITRIISSVHHVIENLTTLYTLWLLSFR